MKRISIIVILFLVVLLAPMTFGQIQSFGGELRYQHQYQDASDGVLYSTSVRRNPILTLGMNGYVFSPTFVSLGLRTSINANYNSSQFGSLSYSSNQYFFNYYDLNLSALQNYYVTLSVGANEGKSETSTDLPATYNFANEYRHQQQRITLSTQRIEFLPVTTVSYFRNHQWAIGSSIPSDQLQEEYQLRLISSGQNSSINLTVSQNNNTEKYSGMQQQYFRVQMNGTKAFTENHRVDVTSEYYKYEEVRYLSNTGTYYGILGEKVRLNTLLQARNFFGSRNSSVILDATQNFQYIHTEHFSYFLSMNFGMTKNRAEENNVKQRNLVTDWGSSASVQHSTAIGLTNFTNTLSLGYVQRKSDSKKTSISGGISNSFQTTISEYQLSGTQSISVIRRSGYEELDQINNNIGVSVAGRIIGNIFSQSSIDYRDERHTGEGVYLRNVRTLQAQQLMNTSFYYYIPLTVSAGANLYWFFSEGGGKTYGWNLNLSSSEFFIRDLSANYRYSKSYSPYYATAAYEQTAEVRYQWRMLSFYLRLSEFRTVDRRREVWFSVVRPF